MGGYRRNLLGQRFSRLTVIGYGKPAKGARGENLTTWVCRCDCGAVKTIRASELIRHRTVSCGCLGRENRIKSTKIHGLSGKRIYHIYLGMVGRCYDENHPSYKSYGGRGISVCDNWLGENGSICFTEWAYSNGYSDELSLDRINVNGNYEPENCRFITNKEQQNNKRNNVRICVDGVTKTMKEWSEKTGIGYTTIKQRIYAGWNPADAVKIPVDKRFSHNA